MAEFTQLPPDGVKNPGTRWYADMTRYQWWVLIVAALGWLFDTMDQTLFRLTRQSALVELLGSEATNQEINRIGGIATALFLVGWATGGLIFGILGDRWGRARTMMITILLYSIFTGLSALSVNWMDYTFYRFLTGVGVGGEFAAGVALVSESLPARARPVALGLLQALSAVGNLMGAGVIWTLNAVAPKGTLLSMPAFFSGSGEAWVWELTGWRLAMLAGVFPALLVVAIMRTLREPDSWLEAKARAAAGGDLAKELGSIRELFSDRRWRRNTIIGITLASAGVISVWGVSFWTAELLKQDVIPKDVLIARGVDPADVETTQTRYVAIQDVLQQIGSFFGILAYTWLATTFGRKPAFLMSFLVAWGWTSLVFGTYSELSQMYWMIPLLGFFQMTVFGGFAIYFPELFPTRLRSTGIGFCYNVGRYIAAIGPLTLGQLTVLYKDLGFAPLRSAALTVLTINLVGLIAAWYAPETKDKELPT